MHYQCIYKWRKKQWKDQNQRHENESGNWKGSFGEPKPLKQYLKNISLCLPRRDETSRNS